MLECKICGTKFNAVIERHYLARDKRKRDYISFVKEDEDDEQI